MKKINIITMQEYILYYIIFIELKMLYFEIFHSNFHPEQVPIAVKQFSLPQLTQSSLPGTTQSNIQLFLVH